MLVRRAVDLRPASAEAAEGAGPSVSSDTGLNSPGKASSWGREGPDPPARDLEAST